MAYQTIKLEYDGPLVILTLNRPEKRNAISDAMISDIPAALAEIEQSSAQILIMTGAGSAFCAGMDLETLRSISEQTRAEHLEDARRMGYLFHSLYSFPKPVICAVNGPAIAGGTGLATLADFTLAVPEAKFGYTEVRIGFLPAVVSVFLIRQVGEKRARELLMSARIFDAEEARSLGLVTEVVPADRLMHAARLLASSLLASSPASLRRTKWLILNWNAKDIERDLELAVHESAEIRLTQDFSEGLSAFLEKRKPGWTGR
jgi:methylglutaconyl-CoA hydratase